MDLREEILLRVEGVAEAAELIRRADGYPVDRAEQLDRLDEFVREMRQLGQAIPTVRLRHSLQVLDGGRRG
jgi:hypothetical protein